MRSESVTHSAREPIRFFVDQPASTRSIIFSAIHSAQSATGNGRACLIGRNPIPRQLRGSSICARSSAVDYPRPPFKNWSLALFCKSTAVALDFALLTPPIYCLSVAKRAFLSGRFERVSLR